MKTIYKVLLGFFSLTASIAGPISLNAMGVIGVGTAIAMFMALFGGLLVFGGTFAAIKFLKSVSPGVDRVRNSSPDDYAGLLEEINDELSQLEGRDRLDLYQGEEMRTEQKMIPDMNQKYYTFIGVVALKAEGLNKVVVIYSPDKKARNGTNIWRYQDDPSPQKRSNPFHEFEPFGNAPGRMIREEERRGEGEGDISINLNNKKKSKNNDKGFEPI